MKNVSALSKITVRENASVNGVVRKMIAVARHSIPFRRANQASAAAVIKVNIRAGRRAAVSVGPRNSMNAAEAAKKMIGLSRYGSPSRRGIT